MLVLNLAFIAFLFLILLTPCFVFFPYTTLFRSRSGGDRAVRRAGPGRAPRQERAHRRGVHVGGRGRGGRRRAALSAGHLLDRKSTRLNSSHSSISYAVFCLKKKILKVRCRLALL